MPCATLAFFFSQSSTCHVRILKLKFIQLIGQYMAQILAPLQPCPFTTPAASITAILEYCQDRATVGQI